MDPLMLMLLSAGLKAGQSAVTGAGQIDLLSAEEKNRQKELERRLALGELGLDEASKQQIMGQQMGPQQAAEREAFSRQAQQQQIADIGQGSAFRGQQALLEAGAIGRASATQRGQDVITERDVLAEAAQLREIDRLKAQRQQNMAGAGMIIGGVGDAALQASGGIMAKGYQDSVEASMLKAAETKATGSVGKKTGASQNYLDWAKSQGAPPVVPPPVVQPNLTTALPDLSTTTTAELVEMAKDPTNWQAQGELDFRHGKHLTQAGQQQIASPLQQAGAAAANGSKKVSWGTLTPSQFDEAGNIIEFSYVSNKGKTSTMAANAKVLAEYNKGK